MRIVAVFLIIGLLVSCAPVQQTRDEQQATVQVEVTSMNQFLTTNDGTKIAYDYFAGAGTKGVVLVHQLPSNRKSWAQLVPKLQEKRWHVIAIDYRGRGESGGQLQSAQDYQNIGLDVDAAIEFLASKGVGSIAVVGASIGANHAILAGDRDVRVNAVVLLSPGIDYRGVKTDVAAAKFTKALFTAAAKDDAYAAESAQKIHDLAKGVKELKIYDNAGHGTNMFVMPDLIPAIVNFVEKNI